MTLEQFRVKQPREIMMYSDVDGTLVSESNELHPDVAKQIERFVDAGFGFSLATGRSLAAVKRFLSQIPVNTPIVLCNGAYVYDPYSMQASWTSLKKEIVYEILSRLANETNICMYMDRSDGSLLISNPRAMLDPFVLKENLRPLLWEKIYDVFDGGDILKVGIKLSDTRSQTLRLFNRTLTDIIANFHTEVRWCFSSNNYIEILPAGISKWSGIVLSQEIRGCQDKSIYAIGDHQNDIEMIQFADVGIAMENAIEEVKQAASYSIGHVNDHAIASLLTDLLTKADYINKSIV